MIIYIDVYRVFWYLIIIYIIDVYKVLLVTYSLPGN